MATVDSMPTAHAALQREPSYDDDHKIAEKGEKSSVSSNDISGDELVGAVFSDKLRQEDVDEEGKERPIVTDMDIATRLVSLEDDPTLPIYTFRMWFLGLGISAFGAVLGQIFFFRPQTIYVSQLFIQIIAYLMGVGLSQILPGPHNPLMTTADTPFWRWINPGSFNIKEHVAIVIMSSTAADSALAISIFAADDLYYNIKPNAAVGVFTLIGSQLMGYGLGGLMRSFLVHPTYIVFPNLLPTVQLFDALHRGKTIFSQVKRVRFFWGLFIAIFVWEWFPEYIAPTLTGISIFCLASQKSPWVTRIFGGAAGNEGLGMFSICLDWNYLGSGGGSMGALFTPLSTQMTLYFGTMICMIASCVAFYNDAWGGASLPFLSQSLYLRNATHMEEGTYARYNQLSILDDNYRLDQAKLDAYGLPWFASTQVLSKLGANMAIGATVTHVLVWYGKDIIRMIKAERKGETTDPHRLKMQVYPEVPYWWYMAVFAASIAMALPTMYAAHSQLPWLRAVFLPFVVTVYAITGFSPNIQSLVQMIGAVIVPGSPHANMYFTLYGFNTLDQARGLIRDLKMGQYTKLPPRVTFTVQSLGAVIGGLLNFVIMQTVITTHREVLLAVQGTNIWSGQQVQTFNSNSVTWGALGEILYAPTGRYWFIPFGVLFGLVVPLPFWLIHRFFPKLGANNVVTPILCWTLGYLAVGINSSIFGTFCLAVFSQYYLRRYRASWFRKYNFLASAALDGGTQVMVFVFSFAVGGGSGKVYEMPNWALNPTGNPDYCMRLT